MRMTSVLTLPSGILRTVDAEPIVVTARTDDLYSAIFTRDCVTPDTVSASENNIHKQQLMQLRLEDRDVSGRAPGGNPTKAFAPR